MTRTAAELDRMRKAAPFTLAHKRLDAKLYMAFLPRKPARTTTFPLVDEKEALEVLVMTDREVFVVSRRKKDGFSSFSGTAHHEEARDRSRESFQLALEVRRVIESHADVEG